VTSPGHREWGDPAAPAVVFWPGIGGTAITPVELAPALTARGRRLIGLDPPLDPDADYGLDTLADEMAAAATPPFVAMGHSWGASVAAVCAARHPDRVSALVLLDGGFASLAEHAGGTRELRVLAIAEHRRSQSWGGWDAMLDETRRRTGRWTVELEEARRAEAREVDGRVVLRMSPEAAAAAGRALDAYDPLEVLPALGESGLPVLLALAARPPERRAELTPYAERCSHRVPQATVSWLDAGHDLLGELGPELGTNVAEWLEAHA
jgi:pimeloyl-ACP methyl ester carboxylesterase